MPKHAITTHRNRIRQFSKLIDSLPDSKSPLNFIKSLLNGTHYSMPEELISFLAGLNDDERQFWVATLFAKIKGSKWRDSVSAYFTPPHLILHLIDRLTEVGALFKNATVLDPASGGAAFLVPVARRMIDKTRGSNNKKGQIDNLKGHLIGIEIDKELVSLSQLLISDVFGKKILNCIHIINEDALSPKIDPGPVDIIIGNPPFGRVTDKKATKLRSQYNNIVSDGYVNLFHLFIARSISWLRPGGFAGLIVPTSFIGGPYSRNLRKCLANSAELVSIDLIKEREELFLDVIQDVCCIVFQKRPLIKRGRPKLARCTRIANNGQLNKLGTFTVPKDGSSWTLPIGFIAADGFSLADLGYRARVGSVVWNREKGQCSKRRNKKTLPLYWFTHVKGNSICAHVKLPGQDRPLYFYKDKQSPSVIHGQAILIQRTSNSLQKRRIVAGLSDPNIPEFIAENHLIVVEPDPLHKQGVDLNTLCKILNSDVIDTQYRARSGSLNISVTILRELPFPNPVQLKRLIKSGFDFEEAMKNSYVTK